MTNTSEKYERTQQGNLLSGVALSRGEHVELRSTGQVAKLRCVERVEVIAVSSTREVAE